ncbi:MAG TPA: signal peptide peptidase SppA [Tepidisphaeraceae bacterium]|nr:signal peptide peptidase SppA [Tepidisphaeraceae bacterium]
MLRSSFTLSILSVLLLLSGPLAVAQSTQPAGQAIIPVFRLHDQLLEQPDEGLFAGPSPVLRDLVLRMKYASADPNVKAVVLIPGDCVFGQAQAEELRQAIANLQNAGKPVYAYCDYLFMNQYVLVSAASRLSVAPTAEVWVMGLYGETPYLRGLLDKIGVTPDIIHCGAYKDAGEIFMRTGPSKEADQMNNWLLDSIYSTDLSLIASGRHVTADQVKSWIDNGPYMAEQAPPLGMIDAAEDKSELQSFLRQKYGDNAVFDANYDTTPQPTLNFSNPFSLFGDIARMMGEKPAASSKPVIGIVYVDGVIVQGTSEDNPFGSSCIAYSADVSRALDQAAADDSVKAVVMRIDSPGGSGTASEIIYRAARRLAAKKPLVVSMGDLAGSGGYYVACAAPTLFADKTTLTASIGVVGGKFATTDMWNKIGITWKSYKRGANADLMSSAAVFTPDQLNRIQSFMNAFYDIFKSRVTTSRGTRLTKPIDDIDGGRVYTGDQALALGLIDKIGSLDDAIQYAAAQAKVANYDVRPIPAPKNFLQRLMEQASGEQNQGDLLAAGSHENLLTLAAPYLTDLDPSKVQMIDTALEELELLQNEGAILIMPPSAADIANTQEPPR